MTHSSFLSKLYQKTYNFLCGQHPYCYPWHFQWHFLKDTHRWQRKIFTQVHGKILDVGCGMKPYKNWFSSKKVHSYIGIDVDGQGDVDIVLTPGKLWPIEDNSFDFVFSTQVMEHIKDISHFSDQINRVLKKGGKCVITVPFMYPVHGEPHDYRRWTLNGLASFFSNDMTINQVVPKGKVGSVLSTLLLTWINNRFNSSFVARLAKGFLLPVWILFSFVINMLGLFLNVFDDGKTHYCNTCIILEK